MENNQVTIGEIDVKMSKSKQGKTGDIHQGRYFLDGVYIPYCLSFKRVKNLNLRVKKDGSFCLSAPHGTGEDAAMRFVARHEDFLRRALQRVGQARPIDRTLEEQNFKHGTTLYLLERSIVLFVEEAKEKIPHGAYALCFKSADENTDGEIWQVHFRSGLNAKQRKTAVARAVISQEIFLLQQTVEKLLPAVCQRIFDSAVQIYCGGVPNISEEILRRFPNARFVLDNSIQLRFREMKSQWGSCSMNKGIVNVNARLIFTTVGCVEYLLFHEICHFFFGNHSSEFYRLLNHSLPDADARRTKLREF
jgi:predicted metal-dependent hydrolase